MDYRDPQQWSPMTTHRKAWQQKVKERQHCMVRGSGTLSSPPSTPWSLLRPAQAPQSLPPTSTQSLAKTTTSSWSCATFNGKSYLWRLWSGLNNFIWPWPPTEKYIQFSSHFPITSSSLSFLSPRNCLSCLSKDTQFSDCWKTPVVNSAHSISDLIPAYTHQDVPERFRPQLIFLAPVNVLSVLGLLWTYNFLSVSTFSQHFPRLHLIPYMWIDWFCV